MGEIKNFPINEAKLAARRTNRTLDTHSQAAKLKQLRQLELPENLFQSFTPSY